jgi:hypothetical protein
MLTAVGQKPEIEGELILMNRHHWRGSQFGDAMAIEPSVTISSGGFSFNVWSALTPNNSYSEVDLIPSYSFKNYTVTLFDYYNPIPGEDNQYLNFTEEKNRHSLELALDNYMAEKQRLKWMIGTFMFGDKNEETGKPYYSTYIELKYPFSFWILEAEPFVGLTPFKGLYADKFAVINTGVSISKELDFKLPFSIPLSLSFISNPYAKQGFVIFAGGIAF